MSPGQFDQVAELFEKARKLEVQQRIALFDEACAEDPDLRDEVESLLKRHDRLCVENRFEALQGEIRDRAEAVTAESVPCPTPRTIGRYEIKDVIATGGMGTVYRAVQDHPHRVVALKVLRQGAVSRQSIQRFRHEAEILGRLKHPHIAQVHDAGTFDEGQGAQPFFAMELIDGLPLIRYTDSKKLGTRDRLRLFEKVCQAVQYAHLRGVIHRDLKPDNILVDEHGEPKVLDFGVARATDADIQVTTLRTDIGQLVGTIPYMSPEQVSGNPEMLDTRSDVYSLGVVLFELLVGRLPHELADKTIPEAIRIIGDEDPQRLSSVDRSLRGDLDTIVAKALERDKTRRYQSAGEFATDVRHYLTDEPITARPASTFYQLTKFARRNRALVVGVAASFLLLLSGTIGIAWQWRSARNEAARATQVSEFVLRMFALVNPGEGNNPLEPPDPGGRLPDVEALLDVASASLDEEFTRWPDVLASLHLRFGRTYWGLGRFEEARHHFARAHEVLDETFGPDHEETLMALWWQTQLVARHGGSMVDQVRNLERIAAGLQVRLGHRARRTLAAEVGLANALFAAGRHGEGESRFRAAITALIDEFGPDDRLTLFTQRSLGGDLGSLSRHEEAHKLLDNVWQRSQRTMSKDDLALRNSAVTFGRCLNQQGRFDEAEFVLREAIELGHLQPTPDLSQTDIRASNFLAHSLIGLERIEEAEQVLRDRLAECEQYLGVNYYTLWAAERVSWILAERDRSREGADMLTDYLERMTPELGVDLHVILFRVSLADLLEDVDEFDKAEDHLREAADDLRHREVEPRFLNSTLRQLTILLKRRGKLDQAEETARERLEYARQAFGMEDYYTLHAMRGLAWIVKDRGPQGLAEAEDLLRDAIEVFRRARGEDHPDTRETMHLLEVILDMGNRLNDGEP